MENGVGSEIAQSHPNSGFGPMGIASVLWAYPFLSLILMAVNLYFIVHAIKTGRPYYWVWIIFAMPVLETIIRTFRRGNALLRKAEQDWYFKAKQMLKKQ